MQGAICAISKLIYGLSVCTDDNHSLKLVAYRLVHTDEPYINLYLYLGFLIVYWNNTITHFKQNMIEVH